MLRERGAILLVACYELGHQPLGTAWPAAFLTRAGFAPTQLDLAVQPFDEDAARRARLVAIAVPMLTALRIGIRAAERIRRLNPACTICFHGHYAVLNQAALRAGPADVVLGGEVEEQLVALAQALDGGASPEPRAPVELERLAFPAPERRGLPPLERYVRFQDGDRLVTAGSVAASRGCLHHCLHCPIPPIYGGRFFVVPAETVLADVGALVAAGAGHISFSDPDFLNGPGHALKVARGLHAAFPDVTFDFTAKIEHLLEQRALLREFRALGCRFVVSAVESLSDAVLGNLLKGHTRADVHAALAACRAAGLVLRPSFVAFTPWTTLDDYLELFHFVDAHDLYDAVDPVQLTVRLLVPPGSGLLAHDAIRPFLGALDPALFSYRWTHPDPRMDWLHARASALVREATAANEAGADTIARLWDLARTARGDAPPHRDAAVAVGRARSPRLTEPWFC